MTAQTHDWWSHLSPFERAQIRTQERETERKEQLLESLERNRGWDKTKQRLQLEIAGHRFMRQQYQNRGTQRAKLGRKPSLTMRDRRITHVENRKAS